MSAATIVPGVLSVGSAMPDPPFEFTDRGQPAGFDIELMKAIAVELGLEWRLDHYGGADFNGIFDGLATKTFDCIASGTTITPERQRVAMFCDPYVQSGQSLVCNVEATPRVRSIDDLRGLVLGVQEGNTSEPVAHRLKAEGRIADIRTYAYHDIGKMLDDLAAGRIGGVMKLAPVMHWLIKDRPRLRVVQERITDEKLAIAVGLHNIDLCRQIDDAQTRLRNSGMLGRLSAKWLGA
jgi:ABC-type amino acid transport substrate-binding protein